LSHIVAAGIGELAARVCAYTQIVKLAVGKECIVLADQVARGAIAAFGEDFQAVYRRLAEGSAIAQIGVSIVERIPGKNKPLENPERLGHLLNGDRAGTVGALEHLNVD